MVNLDKAVEANLKAFKTVIGILKETYPPVQVTPSFSINQIMFDAGIQYLINTLCHIIERVEESATIEEVIK